MAPKSAPEDALGPAATGAWFEAADNYQEELDRAKAEFQDMRRQLPPKEAKADGTRKEVPEEDRFFDQQFLIEPNPAPCWYIGGKANDASEILTSHPPHAWERVSDLHSAPSVFSPKKYTCVVQGATSNGYLVEAMQAVGLREHLVRRLLPDTYDAERGLYVVMLYKNACWVRVVVDDYVPMDQHSDPLCCTSYQWPSVCWPALVEKAYAKRHGSYEGISRGGSVVEALVDLTGGQGGQFNIRDVSGDRLFTYLHELQAEALFVCRVDAREAAKPGVRLTTKAPYVINRAMGHEGGKYLQLCCPGIAGGPFDDDVPPSLVHSRFFPERASDGFFWVRVELFQRHFSEIFECRLTANDNLDQIQLYGQPVPRPLAMKRPASHRLYATLAKVRASFEPEFRIHVHESAGPTEVYLMLSQDDIKLREKDYDLEDRAGYVPITVRVYQMLPGKCGGCAKVAQSSYAPARDAFVGFKASCAAEFLVRVTLPVGTCVEKLILRLDTTALPPHVEVQLPKQGGLLERHTWIEPKEPLGGFPLSFVGSAFATPKHAGDTGIDALSAKAYEMGCGHPKGHHFLTGDGEGCAVQ